MKHSQPPAKVKPFWDNQWAYTVERSVTRSVIDQSLDPNHGATTDNTNLSVMYVCTLHTTVSGSGFKLPRQLTIHNIHTLIHTGFLLRHVTEPPCGDPSASLLSPHPTTGQQWPLQPWWPPPAAHSGLSGWSLAGRWMNGLNEWMNLFISVMTQPPLFKHTYNPYILMSITNLLTRFNHMCSARCVSFSINRYPFFPFFSPFLLLLLLFFLSLLFLYRKPPRRRLDPPHIDSNFCKGSAILPLLLTYSASHTLTRGTDRK